MEKRDIINRGGDMLRKKNMETADLINGMNLSDHAMNVITNTDINMYYELFGEMTAPEIESFIKDTY